METERKTDIDARRCLLHRHCLESLVYVPSNKLDKVQTVVRSLLPLVGPSRRTWKSRPHYGSACGWLTPRNLGRAVAVIANSIIAPPINTQSRATARREESRSRAPDSRRVRVVKSRISKRCVTFPSNRPPQEDDLCDRNYLISEILMPARSIITLSTQRRVSIT